MKKFLLAVVLFLTVAFIITRIAEMQAIIATLQRGDWHFLLIALILVGVWLLNIASCYRAIYQAIGLKETVENLIPVAAAANFLNIVAPSAGMSGMAVFVAEARRRNYSSGRAAIAGALYILFDYAAFLCVLALGIMVLFRRNNLNPGEIIASVILVIMAIGIASLIYLGTHSAVLLGKVLSWMARQVNRLLRPFLHHEYLSERRAHEFAYEAAEGLREMSLVPRNLVLPVILALTKQALLISILLLSFFAFQVPVSLGTVIAGFSIGYLFLIISPTPNGLGVVEGVLTLVLSSMYVPFGAAAVITLAYRGLTFWTPLFIGMIALRWLGKGEKIQAEA